MAEALLNNIGRGKFAAHSAGSHPKGEVHPLALEVLGKNRLAVEGLRSKSWNELAGPDAPEMDFVFTVCDQAAGESCPLWPGRPMRAHWGLDDPAAAKGDDAERRRAFLRAFNEIENRLLIFVSLPLAKLDRSLLQRRLDEIGRLSTEEESATDLSDRIRSASRPLRVNVRPRGRQRSADA
jgi:protein-tyrosine-phosphatase